MIIKRKNKVNSDPRGAITSGYMGKDGLPKKSFYFLFENPETKEPIFPELLKLYGDKCSEIYLTFPTNDFVEYFTADMNKWGKTNNRTRTCDTHNCTVFIDCEFGGKKYSAGDTTHCICKAHNLAETDKKLLCKCDMMLKAYILHPTTFKIISPLCYKFFSHSINSTENIMSELEKHKVFRGLPFVLSVKEVKKQNFTFPIWNLYPHITPEQLIEYNLDIEMVKIGMSVPEEEEKEKQRTAVPDNKLFDDIEEAEYSEETGEDINYANEIEGFVNRIKRATTVKDSIDALQIIIQTQSLSDSVKTALKKEADKHINFIKSLE